MMQPVYLRYISIVAVFSLVVSAPFIPMFASAWTGPTAVAPGNNTAPPIDTSATAQTKAGNFAANNISANAVGSLNGYCIGASCITSWATLGQWATSGSNIYFNTGKVGVGTNNPNKQLSVSANVPAANGVDASTVIQLYNSASDGTVAVPNETGISFGYSSTRQAILGGTYGNDFLDFFTGGVLTSPRMRIDANGNVGIGTANPTAQLTLAEAGQAQLDMYNTNTGGTPSAGAYWRMFVDNVGGGGGNLTWGMFDARNSAIRLGIDNSGNVGIGTSNPDHKLTVYGTDPIASFMSSGSNAYIRLSVNSDLNQRLELANRGGRTALWNPKTGDDFNIVHASGNVGIGTTNPVSLLQVNGTATFGADANATVSAWSAAGEGGIINLRGANGTNMFLVD